MITNKHSLVWIAKFFFLSLLQRAHLLKKKQKIYKPEIKTASVYYPESNWNNLTPNEKFEIQAKAYTEMKIIPCSLYLKE